MEFGVGFETVHYSEGFLELNQARGHFLWLVTQKLNQVLAYSKARHVFWESQSVTNSFTRNARKCVAGARGRAFYV